MSDVREAVIVRLIAIGTAIPGIRIADRNNIDPPDQKFPRITVLDADEDVSPAVVEGSHRPATAPIPMVMVPEILVLVDEKAKDVGSVLNGLRIEIIKAVLFDATLAGIIGTNGAIQYRGLNNDLGVGRAMLGRMALRFAISYVVNPRKL